MDQILKQDYQPNLPLDSKSIEYSDVELTEEEIADAIGKAKNKKHDLLEFQRREKVRVEMENFYRSDWSFEDFVLFLKDRMKSTGFIVDDSNRNIVNALCYYFNGILNERNIRVGQLQFEKYKLNDIGIPMDLKKGLYLFGPVGVGKTRIMELFTINKLQCYQLLSCRKVVSEYIKNGTDVILPLSKQSYPFVKSIDNFWHENMGVCFDDLGTESESANNYGNKLNVFEQIILDRYDNHVPFNQTHITSNLTPELIKQRYGERVISRMRENYNLIELGGVDRRR